MGQWEWPDSNRRYLGYRPSALDHYTTFPWCYESIASSSTDSAQGIIGNLQLSAQDSQALFTGTSSRQQSDQGFGLSDAGFPDSGVVFHAIIIAPLPAKAKGGNRRFRFGYPNRSEGFSFLFGGRRERMMGFEPTTSTMAR